MVLIPQRVVAPDNYIPNRGMTPSDRDMMYDLDHGSDSEHLYPAGAVIIILKIQSFFASSSVGISRNNEPRPRSPHSPQSPINPGTEAPHPPALTVFRDGGNFILSGQRNDHHPEYISLPLSSDLVYFARNIEPLNLRRTHLPELPTYPSPGPLHSAEFPIYPETEVMYSLEFPMYPETEARHSLVLDDQAGDGEHFSILFGLPRQVIVILNLRPSLFRRTSGPLTQ